MEPNSDSLIVVSQNQVSADLSTDGAGQFVILGLQDGIYFELSEVGARIWQLVQQPCTIASVIDVLIDEYEVTREQCAADVMSLLAELRERGLVEIRDGKAA